MKPNYCGFPWHSRRSINHCFPLTDSQKLELAEEMADARAEITRLEEELAATRKNYKEEIDMHAGILSSAASKFKAGVDAPVEVFCDVYQDFKREELVFVSVESGEELERRPMSQKDKLPSLFSSPEEAVQVAKISKISGNS